jgi:membrane-associated phospholipid phosphatase
VGGALSDLIIDLGQHDFRARDWAAKWNAYRLLFEFLDPGIGGGISPTIIQAVDDEWDAHVPVPGPGPAHDEIALLVRFARDERAEALGEILSQDAEFITDFMSLLSITPGSHGKMYRLLHGASLIALYAAQYFKGEHPHTRNRPRPSQVCPALMPPIPLPGHASFPSGHATQAYLLAFCINEVLAGKAFRSQIFRNARVLARRIARNREIAGLHYPSDSWGGEVLAHELFTALNAMAAGSAFQQLVTEARDELEWVLP